MISQYINELISYGLDNDLIDGVDVQYVKNLLCDLLQIEGFDFEYVDGVVRVAPTLEKILDEAVKSGLLEDTTVNRDLFDTKVMGLLTPRPSEVVREFKDRYEGNPEAATDWYYEFSQATNYIRVDRIEKDQKWQAETEYGTLDVTINLSKPEKDPKDIAKAKLVPSSSYPKCPLCVESVGFAGDLNKSARQNHRIVPVELDDERWYLQYSPYVYYNEHSILLKEEHSPMTISEGTFRRLFAFVKQFPHYFVGANADLPIVGGSILSHDHFQAGNYEFPMERAEVLAEFELSGYPGVTAHLLNWPMTVIRLSGEDSDALIELGGKMLAKWRGYSDESLRIYAETDGTPHNTITPIARFKNGQYELDLVLRNNRTSDAHPDGIFHPHAQYHHLKKENIGLIEVMGMAILPGRLKTEIQAFTEALIKQDINVLIDAGLDKHSHWFNELAPQLKDVDPVMVAKKVEENIGRKFGEILACCGVFKLDEEGKVGVKQFMEGF